MTFNHGPFDVRRRDAILYRIARLTAEIVELQEGSEREKYEEEVWNLLGDLDEMLPGWQDRTPLERKPRQQHPSGSYRRDDGRPVGDHRNFDRHDSDGRGDRRGDRYRRDGDRRERRPPVSPDAEDVLLTDGPPRRVSESN